MTTREFIQHLILNCDLDDPVFIEVCIPSDVEPGRYVLFDPKHASKIGEDTGCPESLIECRRQKGDH